LAVRRTVPLQWDETFDVGRPSKPPSSRARRVRQPPATVSLILPIPPDEENARTRRDMPARPPARLYVAVCPELARWKAGRSRAEMVSRLRAGRRERTRSDDLCSVHPTGRREGIASGQTLARTVCSICRRCRPCPRLPLGASRTVCEGEGGGLGKEEARRDRAAGPGEPEERAAARWWPRSNELGQGERPIEVRSEREREGEKSCAR